MYCVGSFLSIQAPIFSRLKYLPLETVRRKTETDSEGEGCYELLCHIQSTTSQASCKSPSGKKFDRKDGANFCSSPIAALGQQTCEVLKNCSYTFQQRSFWCIMFAAKWMGISPVQIPMLVDSTTFSMKMIV